jgi:uncharacterized protein YqhQ
MCTEERLKWKMRGQAVLEGVRLGKWQCIFVQEEKRSQSGKDSEEYKKKKKKKDKGSE